MVSLCLRFSENVRNLGRKKIFSSYKQGFNHHRNKTIMLLGLNTLLNGFHNFSFKTQLKIALFTIVRPIIVNFLFIVISCTRSLMRRHVVIILLFGKIFENFVFSSLSFFMYFYMCFVHTSRDFKTI